MLSSRDLPRVALRALLLLQCPAGAQVLRGGGRAGGPEPPALAARRLTSRSPVEEHSWLRTQGNQIVGQHGKPVRLRGMSLFWSQWMPQYWNKATVHWLRSDWRVSVVRAAMGVEADKGGYLANKVAEMEKVEVVVQAAIHAGIYVIIDWHDHKAEQHADEAAEFFQYMSERYSRFPNVLFETYNEPYPGVTWPTIKSYHARILDVIRQHSAPWHPPNIVILGSAEWSQRVDEAAADPVYGGNVAYAIHFYTAAAEHNAPLQSRVVAAMKRGVPVFASEWGVCHYTGQGVLDTLAGQAWLSFMTENNISDTAWAVSNKPGETCSVLRPGSFTGGGGWSPDELTENGVFFRSSLRRDGQGGCSEPGEDCRSTACCADASLRCFGKDQWWAECRASCTVGVDRGFDTDPRWQTPWKCEDIGRAEVFEQPACSLPGHDCRSTRCCRKPGTTCYEKNQWWASCRAECTPDEPGDRWSCLELRRKAAAPVETSRATEHCAGDIEDCRQSKCCKRAGTTCFQKDDHWAECKETCSRGKVDFSDPPQYWTPWRCNEISP